MAVSQPGKDVKVTADRFFTLSSSFQSLKVFAVTEATTTIPAAGTNTITVTHNLGYYAPVIIVYNGSTTLGQGTSYLNSDHNFPLDIEISTTTIKINVADDFDSGYSASGDTVYFTVYSFIDNFDTFSSPVLNTDTSDNSDGVDYGFRISKPGFDVRTCADVDCIVTSKRSSMTVHMKGIDTTGTVTHSLSYIPTYLGFVKYSGNNFLSLANQLTSISGTQLDWGMSSGDSLYYVIFKSKTV